MKTSEINLGSTNFGDFWNKKTFVVKGYANEWNAVKYWNTIAYFEKILPVHRESRVFTPVNIDNSRFVDNEKYVNTSIMSTVECIRHVLEYKDKTDSSANRASSSNDDSSGVRGSISKSGLMYIRSEVYEELSADVHTPDIIIQLLLDQLSIIVKFNTSLSGLWFSCSGCITPLHYDEWHGFLIQLQGTKTVSLFPYRDLPLSLKHKSKFDIYNISNGNRSSSNNGSNSRNTVSYNDRSTPLYNDSGAHINCIDLDAYNSWLSNKSKENCSTDASVNTVHEYISCARSFTIHLFPGDMIYIPPWWWHHVVSTSNSVSITYRIDACKNDYSYAQSY